MHLLKKKYLTFLLPFITSPALSDVQVLTPDLSFLDDNFTNHLLVANSPELTPTEQAAQPVSSWGGNFTIAKDGKIIYEKAFGSADQNSTPVDVSNTFRLASVHKPITAVGIMKLVQDGQISLDDTVFGPNGLLNQSVYYQGININNPNQVDPRITSITVGHLLSHRSGWQDNHSFPFDMRQVRADLQSQGLSVPSDTVDQMIKLSLVTPLTTDPGFGTGSTLDCDTRSDGWSYNNVGPQMLGRVIEQVSGKTLENFFLTEVFGPAGITEIHESVSWQGSQPQGEVYFFNPGGQTSLPYNTDDPNDPMVPTQYGGFPVERTWSASSRALVKLLLNFELPDSDPDKILTDSTLDQMLVPPTVSTTPFTRFSDHGALNWHCEVYSYAHGWGRGTLIDVNGNWEYHWMIPGEWSHNGGMPGTMSFLRRDEHGYAYAGVVNIGGTYTTQSTEDVMFDAAAELRDALPGFQPGVFEAEHQVNYDGSVLNNKYVDINNSAGSTIDFIIVSPEDGTASVDITYASAANLDMKVIVNNTTEIASITFNSTGSWTSDQTKSITVGLVEGTNTVRFEALDSQGGPNFDKLEAELGAASPSVSCTLADVSAQSGNFGVNNAYVTNTGSQAINGWSVDLDFESATPTVNWSWGGTVSASGNTVTVSNSNTLSPSQSAYFGFGGTYSGSTPNITCH